LAALSGFTSSAATAGFPCGGPVVAYPREIEGGVGQPSTRRGPTVPDFAAV
jgi:hypothetical protein